MKSLKRAILVILVLNLLAMLAGAGWLMASGRVSKDRVLTMTDLFQEPVSIEQARLEKEQKEAEKELAQREKPLPELAMDAEERNRVRVEMTQIDRQRLDRMKREVADLQETLSRERRLIEDDRQELARERAEFEQMRQRLADLEGGEQFKKALATLTGMAPKDARAVLAAMLADGEGKQEEVISYLSAMQARARTQIMTEFVKR
ncbi:MAG: hypothetical protein WD114_05035, partial [Phycisphaerales bacterium]